MQLWTMRTPEVGTVERQAERAEAAGWDGVTFTDSQNLVGDPFVAVALAARVTEHLRFATGVSNVATRLPAALASVAATVNETSGGRFVLGIGRGDTALFHLGRPPLPVAAFTEAEDTVGAAEIEDVVAAWVRQGVSLETVLRYAVLREHHSAVHAITAALLDGSATATMARRCGVEIASHYWVLALAVADPPESAGRVRPDRAQARRRLEQMRAEVFRWSDGTALLTANAKVADTSGETGTKSAAASYIRHS